MSNTYQIKYTGEELGNILPEINSRATIFATDDIFVQYNTPPKDVCKLIVKQLATKTYHSSSSMLSEMAKAQFKWVDMGLNYQNKEFYILYNNRKYKIMTGEETYETVNKFVDGLQDIVNDIIGMEQIQITSVTSSGTTLIRFVNQSNLNLPFYLLSAENPDKDLLTILGFTGSSTQKFSLSQTLGDIITSSGFDETGNLEITINDKSFKFNQSQTIQEIIDIINNDLDIDTTLRYSIDKKFYLERKAYGHTTLTIGGTTRFWSALRIASSREAIVGQNAIINLITPDGETGDIELLENCFEYNGNKINFYSANSNKISTIIV